MRPGGEDGGQELFVFRQPLGLREFSWSSGNSWVPSMRVVTLPCWPLPRPLFLPLTVCPSDHGGTFTRAGGLGCRCHGASSPGPRAL